MLMPWGTAAGDLVMGVTPHGQIAVLTGRVLVLRGDGSTSRDLIGLIFDTVNGVALLPDGRVLYAGDSALFAVPFAGKPIERLTGLWYGHDIAFQRSGGMIVANLYGGVFKPAPDGARLLFLAGDDPASIDLAADQCTLYYVSPSTENIGRYDVCRETPLPALTRAPTHAHEIRITRTGFVVHAQDGIARYDTHGALLGFASTPTSTYSSGLASAADGSIWVATDSGIYLVDPINGAIIRGPFFDGAAISGIAEIGEWRAATSPATADIPALSTLAIIFLAASIAAIALPRLK